MMHRFGCIFDTDIDAADTNPGEIERHYRARYANVDVALRSATGAISRKW